jgi:A/G-specific adenine glycosylase
MKKERAGETGQEEKTKGKMFAKALLHWNHYENKRQMPWKGEKDPYKIWLSEIMLQQTRVEQGLKYYQNFIEAFPDVHALAAATEAKVFKMWEGLGYYSRCRNLIATADYISNELHGVFPKHYEEVLQLKGVGSYTASAIVSFAYNLPYAVLDGNVFRVLSRIFDVELPIDSTQGKKIFSALAQAILPKNRAGEYNQAIMDFGAVICKPLPVCDACFFNRHCPAYAAGKQSLLPVKEKKTVLKKRWLNYFIVQCGDEVLLQQRTEKDIWQGLHQFVLIETEKARKAKPLQVLFQKQYGIEDYTVVDEFKEKQDLSHQSVEFHFLHLHVKRKKKVDNYTWMKKAQTKELAFPRALQIVMQAWNK